MKTEINYNETNRAKAFELWIKSPMPMVTITKTLIVSNLRRTSRKKNLRFNMLLCWCIGKAASYVNEFHILPEHSKLYKYERLAINVIIYNKNGGINSFDVPYSESIDEFNDTYLSLSKDVYDKCESKFLDDHMVIGTSALISAEIDSIVNQYNDAFNNPMVMWGKYRTQMFRTTLPVSFQFHHVQMDGKQAIDFLDYLQKVISNFDYIPLSSK